MNVESGELLTRAEAGLADGVAGSRVCRREEGGVCKGVCPIRDERAELPRDERMTVNPGVSLGSGDGAGGGGERWDVNEESDSGRSVCGSTRAYGLRGRGGVPEAEKSSEGGSDGKSTSVGERSSVGEGSGVGSTGEGAGADSDAGGGREKRRLSRLFGARRAALPVGDGSVRSVRTWRNEWRRARSTGEESADGTRGRERVEAELESEGVRR
jgi:hypothetical protein